MTFGFALYFLHHGQPAVGTTASDELMASPGDFLFYRKRRVAEPISKFLRRLFLALADFAAINDDIMFVRAAVDLDGAEREFVDADTRTPVTPSGAFLRRDCVEGGPALLDFLAAAVRTEDLPLLVVDKGQDS